MELADAIIKIEDWPLGLSVKLTSAGIGSKFLFNWQYDFEYFFLKIHANADKVALLELYLYVHIILRKKFVDEKKNFEINET